MAVSDGTLLVGIDHLAQNPVGDVPGQPFSCCDGTRLTCSGTFAQPQRPGGTRELSKKRSRKGYRRSRYPRLNVASWRDAAIKDASSLCGHGNRRALQLAHQERATLIERKLNEADGRLIV